MRQSLQQFMNAKLNFCTLLTLLTLVIFTSCSVKIDTITPTQLPANPSNIYTISARPLVSNEIVDPKTVRMFIVIDGQKHAMQASPMGKDYFDYEYRLPTGRDSAIYYLEMHYRMRNIGDRPSPEKSLKSDTKHLQIKQRYPIALDVDRAPLGTPITVLGRGFRSSDQIFVGGQACDTRFVSGNALEFILTGLQPDASYPVVIRGNGDAQPAGWLHVDPGNPLSVLPNRLQLKSGERKVLAFILEHPAPSDGLEVLVTTDIPQSIIMPEVFIPAEARTVNVPIIGGEVGRGRLFVKGRGLPEIEVAISVE